MRREPYRGSLTTGSVFRALMRMALPTTVSYLVMNLATLADTFFVGGLGADAMGGVASAAILVGVVITVAASTAVGAEVMISRSWGAGRYEDARRVATQAFGAGVVMSLVFTVLGFLLARPLLDAMALAPAAAAQGARYLEVVALGFPALFLFVPATVGMRASGDAVTPMKAVVLATLVNVALDPVLILGVGPIPALGTAGAGIASVAGRVAGLLYLGRRFVRPGSGLTLRASYLKPDARVLLGMARLSLYACLMMLSYDVANVVLIRVVARFGTQTVAAFGIVLRLYMMVTLPAFGLASAASALVGQNLGAGRPIRAITTVRWAIWSFGGVVVAASVLMIVFAEPLVAAFAREEAVVWLGAWGLALYCPSFLPVVVSMVLGRSMAGAGDTLSPMWIAGVSQLLVRAPAAVLLSWRFERTGFWLALTLSNLVHMVVAAIFFARGRWQRVDPTAALGRALAPHVVKDGAVEQ